MGITRRARFEYIGIGQQTMQRVAEQTQSSVLARIQRGETVNDSPAKPLKSKYARMKNNYTRKHGGAMARQIRNWMLTGHTLSVMRVMHSSATQAVIGFLSTFGPNRKITAAQIAYLRNRDEKQFGMSPRNQEALHNALIEEMRKRPPVVPRSFK